MKLDKESIAGLTLPEGKSDFTWWDETLIGFGYRLRRRVDGKLHATYVSQYRADDGRTRKASIAAAKTTPLEARGWARKILARAELGHDPQAERAAKRRAAKSTVSRAVADYLEAKQSKLRPASYRVAKLYLTGSYFRSLHPLAITAVKRTDVARSVRAIVRKHGDSTGGAARRALSALFAWAIAEGMLDDAPNPVDGAFKPADPASREHVPTPAELATIYRVCRDDDFGRIIRLLILLGSRRSEVGGMCWGELKDGVWTLPKERSKNRRAHTIALPPTALSIVNSLYRTKREHLFGARGRNGFSDWDRGKKDIDNRLADTVRPWRIHDLRRGVATALADLGVEPHHVEALLNHYGGRKGPAGVYNRSRYEQAVRDALLQWSEHVMALVSRQT